MRFLARWFRRLAKTRRTRLSHRQAWAIANAAMAGTHYAGLMGMASVERQGDRLIWQVGSVTKGSGMVVTIDDATGEVVGTRGWGVR